MCLKGLARCQGEQGPNHPAEIEQGLLKGRTNVGHRRDTEASAEEAGALVGSSGEGKRGRCRQTNAPRKGHCGH